MLPVVFSVGLIISNNMCNWHDHLAGRLLPLYHLITGKLRRSDYRNVDETPIDC